MSNRRGAALLVLVLATSVTAEDAHILRAEVRGERLTLLARDVPLERVLAEFSDRLGIEVRGRPAESRKVHADFEAVPVAEALHRLLDRENFTLTYAADGALRSIALHGRLREPPKEEEGAGAVPLAVAAPPPAQPVDAPGADRAARAVVMARPAFGDLLQGASPEQQGAMRAAASRTMLDAMVQDERFLERLRADGGEGPEEFLARLATNAPSEDVRAGAAAALEDLRQRLAGQVPSRQPSVAEGAPATQLPAVERRDRRRRRPRDAARGTPGPPSAMPRR